MNSVPNVLLPDQAVLIATEDELEEQSQWYKLPSGIVFRFVRVPQFLYSMSAAHLRSAMRKKKPKPPVIRKSGREMTNKADPRYIAELELWKQEWEDLTRECNISTAMFRGIELKDPLPPVEQWLPRVLADFESVGIDRESAYATFYYDEDRLHELWFKKFVILKSKAVTEAFSSFQGDAEEDELEVDPEEDEDAAFAADLFQSDQT